MHPSVRTTLTTALLGAALLLPAAAHAEDDVTLVLHQEPFEVAFHDLDGDGGASAGDLYTWVAPVTTADGRTGTIVGDHQVVVLPTEGPFREVRIGTSVIDLGDGDAIALGGIVPVTTPLGEIEPGITLANAIIGGTGLFGGAKGEIDSVRAEDGSWTHTLSFRTAGTVDPARTLLMTMTATDWSIAETSGDGKTGAGDFRVFHSIGSTDDGRTVESRGAHVVVSGPREDGGPVDVVGYSLAVVDGDLEVSIRAQTVTATGGIAGPVNSVIVGGTGRLAGARGAWTGERRDDGTIVSRSVYFADPVGEAERTLVLRSALPEVVTLDRGEPGPSIGDQRSWVLPFTSDAGEPAGTGYGYVTSLSPADDGTSVWMVAGLISVQLADGSTILVADLHPEETALPTAADLAVTRAVIGGTGAWAGASGELVTTVDGNGGLVHTFALRMPGAGM